MVVTASSATAALCSTALISIAPNLILFLFPQYGQNDEASTKTSSLLTLGQAIAAGGLLGDVFLHTIPDLSSHHGEHPEQSILYLLAGFTVFLVADMLIRSLEGGHSHSHGKNTENSNSNSHSHHEHAGVQSAVVLNVAADALHNFTDGLAIGTSYALQQQHSDDHDDGEPVNIPSIFSMAFVSSIVLSRGGIMTLSVLLHEIPHELGDFATLVRSGYSKRQAIVMQLCTAIAALLGTILALVLSASSTTTSGGEETLLYMTAGGFLYLATVTLLPEVLEQEGRSIYLSMAHVLAFLTGIGFLYLVSTLEGHDHHNHSHDGHRHHEPHSHSEL